MAFKGESSGWSLKGSLGDSLKGGITLRKHNLFISMRPLKKSVSSSISAIGCFICIDTAQKVTT